jgi:hypothetical protein
MKPLNLHPHEVRAHLAGNLGLIVRPVVTRHVTDPDYPSFVVRDGVAYAMQYDGGGLKREWQIKSPFGQLGDKMWGRETFGYVRWVGVHDGDLHESKLVYRADNPEKRPTRWHPSMQMTKDLSRIALENTALAVKQVRDITEAEAMACGIQRIEIGPREIDGIAVHPMTGTYAEAFRTFWQKQYGDTQWAWFCSVKGAS